MEIFRELKKVPAFAGVSDKELQAMSNCFKAEICFFDKGQEIIRQGDPLDKVILISKGEANAQNEDMFGNISIILNLKAGDFFGIEEAYAEQDCFKDTLVATEPVTVVLFDKTKIISPCANNCLCHQILSKRMIKTVSSRALALTDKIKHLSQRGIRDKVLSYLQTQSLLAGSRYFDIPFNKTELASYLAVERSALSSVLGKLKQEGVIDFEKKRYHLKGKN